MSLALPLKALEAWKGSVTSRKKTGVKRKRFRQTSFYKVCLKTVKEQEEDKELAKRRRRQQRRIITR